MKHHRFLLRLHLQQIDAIDTAVAEIDREVDERIEPFRITVELLTTIPGIGELGARIIAAEIGNDMSDRHTRCSEQSSRSWHRHPAFPLIRFLSWRLPRVKAVKRV
jgi:transposase